MIKKLLFLLLLAPACFASNDPPIQFNVQPYKQEGGNSSDTLMRYQLDQNNNEIYRQLGNKADLTTSNNFTQPVTISSLTVTSESFGDGTTQTTAYKVLISTRFAYSGGDITTNSATFAPIGGAFISSYTFVCDGKSRFLVTVSGAAYNDTTGRGNYFVIGIDGSYFDPWYINNPAGGAGFSICNTYPTPIISAGQHTLFLEAKTTGGNLTVFADAGIPLVFSVQEVR